MSVVYLIAGLGLFGGGPDGGGYIYYSTQDGDPQVAFEWIDISATADTIALGDDANGVLPLGFSFPIYDSIYDSVLVGSNGALGFNLTASTISFSNRPLPYYEMDFIAIYWDDLSPNVSGSNIYYQTFSDCPDAYTGACFIIQWDNVPHYGESFGQTFQAILYDNGNIKFQYLVLDPNYTSSSTIGIHAADTTAASGKVLQYVYNGVPAEHTPQDSLAILFVAPKAPYHTIAEIQGTMIPGTDSSAFEGDTVTTSGIVVSKGAKTSKGIHIKMVAGGPFSGMMVFISDTTGGFGELALGDEVLLTGTVKEFYGYTELVVASMGDVTVVDSGLSIPIDTVTGSMVSNANPDTAEMYEGVLVFIDSAVVDSQGTYYYYLHDATGAFLLDDNNIDPLVPGSIVRITGLVLYSYGEYKILARSPLDVEVIYEPTPVYPVLTIDTIQRTMDSTYSTVFVGDTAVVTGVVTSLGVAGARNAFLAGNPYGPYNGIIAYFSQGIPSFLSEGDSVEITAVITEYYGNTELYVFDTTLVNVLGTGTIPGPITIPAGYVDTSSTSTYYPEQPDTAEAYEHVLVKVDTLQVTGYNTTDFGTWFVVEAQKGNDRVYFYVDTLNWGTPAIGDYYNVTGYVYTRYGQYVLVPRSATDLEQVTDAAEDLSRTFVKLAAVDRNGIVVRYNLSEPGDVSIRVYAINGRLIVDRSLRLNSGYGEVRIPATLRSGVYIINFNGNRFKTIVR